MKSIDTDVLPTIDSMKAISVLYNFVIAIEPNHIQVAPDSDKDSWLLLKIKALVSQEAEILPKSRLQFNRHCATSLILQVAVYSKLAYTRLRTIFRNIPYRRSVTFISSSSIVIIINVNLLLV
ncbi:hypothetical protein PoB_006923000 [Plakobranchus ocellatus]|uniref:Uncharacterized protein n=1 Tax=Plakobranchus ocellatus TaxID=259542 RepID=A0AAV4DFG5_9GAST|nr:hypothetical protein PoB_006923000 [Plakobranchus ocellatus]